MRRSFGDCAGRATVVTIDFASGSPLRHRVDFPLAFEIRRRRGNKGTPGTRIPTCDAAISKCCIPVIGVGIDWAQISGFVQVAPQLGNPHSFRRGEVYSNLVTIYDKGPRTRLPKDAEEPALISSEIG